MKYNVFGIQDETYKCLPNGFYLISQRIKIRCYKIGRAEGSQMGFRLISQRIKIRCYKIVRAEGSLKNL
jgi:hypothetical protein